MANYPNYNLYGKRPADTFRNIVQFNITASNLVDSYGDELPPISISASVYGTASVAITSIFSDVTVFASRASVATSASWASQSLSASWAPDQTVTVNSASWASQSLSASWAPFTDTGTTLYTGSTYEITSSNSQTSSWSDYANIAGASYSSLTASWVAGNNVHGTVESSSYTLSASWAPFTQVEQISASWASASISASWAPTSITYPLTVLASNLTTASIDFLVGQYFQLDTTASMFTFGNSTNVTAVRNASVYITPQSGSRTIVFHPSWIVMGNFPTTIAHNSASVLSLTTFGSNDATVVAAFASKV